MDKKYIEIAFSEAKKSLLTNDVPVGAVIVLNNKIIAKSHNTREKYHSIIGHAEINCVEQATKKLNTWHLNDCIMYVTMEPCKMCEEVLKQCHIKKVYYSTKRTKKINSDLNKEYIDCGKEAEKLIQNFFENKRK